MDAEQIRQQMTQTRASIDRKLDLLSVQADSAKQHAAQRVRAGATIGVVALAGVWWWRRRRRRAQSRAQGAWIRAQGAWI